MGHRRERLEQHVPSHHSSQCIVNKECPADCSLMDVYFPLTKICRRKGTGFSTSDKHVYQGRASHYHRTSSSIMAARMRKEATGDNLAQFAVDYLVCSMVCGNACRNILGTCLCLNLYCFRTWTFFSTKFTPVLLKSAYI